MIITPKYLVFKLCGIDNRRPLTIDIDIDLGFGFCANVVLAVFIRVVWFVCFSLFLLELVDLIIDIEPVPRTIVVLDCCGISNQIYSLFVCGFFLLSFLCGLFFLLFNLFFQLFLDLLLFGPFFP